MATVVKGLYDDDVMVHNISLSHFHREGADVGHATYPQEPT